MASEMTLCYEITGTTGASYNRLDGRRVNNVAGFPEMRNHKFESVFLHRRVRKTSVSLRDDESRNFKPPALPGYDPDMEKSRAQARILMEKLGYRPDKHLAGRSRRATSPPTAIRR